MREEMGDESEEFLQVPMGWEGLGGVDKGDGQGRELVQKVFWVRT